MYEQKYYITMVLKKHKIAENEFIFTPVKSIALHLNGTYFLDENDILYFPVSSRAILKESINYAIGFCDYYDEYFDVVTDRSDNIDSVDADYILDEYYKEFSGVYYHAIDINGKIRITPLVINSDIRLETFNYGEENTLLEEIEKGKFTKNELEDIKEEILDNENRLNLLKDAITSYEEKIKINNSEVDVYAERGIINIDKLYKQVTKTLVSQDEAAIQLITELAMSDIDKKDKKAILLTGDSGVGKTKLMQLISKYLDRPFLLIDSTQLTSPGYVGRNVEDYLYKLICDCNFDVEKAEQAIVFFDEIDKKGSQKKSDVAGQAVLNVLLKFIDGTTYNVSDGSTQFRKNSSFDIDTSNMMIIAGGAFRDVYNCKKENKIAGFGSVSNEKEEILIEDFFQKAGMPLEFMGRFSIIHLNSLGSEDYIKILKQSDESPLVFAKEKFKKMDNVKLTFTDEYLKKTSLLAENKKTGARGLNVIVSKSIAKPFREVNRNLGMYEEVVLDEGVLEDNNNYQLIKK